MEELKSKLRQGVRSGAPVETLNALCCDLIEQTVLQNCPTDAKPSVQQLCRNILLPIKVRAEIAPAQETEEVGNIGRGCRLKDLAGYAVCLVAGLVVCALLENFLNVWIGATIGAVIGLAAGAAWNRHLTPSDRQHSATPRIVVVSTESEIEQMADQMIQLIEGIILPAPKHVAAPITTPYPLETQKYLRVLRWLQNAYQICLSAREVDEIQKVSIEQLLRGCGYRFVDFAEGMEPYFELTPTTKVDRITTTLPAVVNTTTEEFILSGHAIYPVENI